MEENNRLDVIKTSLIEYINIIESIYRECLSNKPSYKVLLSQLRTGIKRSDNHTEIEAFRNSLTQVEKIIAEKDFEEKKAKLSGRERALVERGYDIDDVINLCAFTEQQAHDIAYEIFERITKGHQRVEHPVCYFLGGQPGCGKSTTSMKIQSNFDSTGIVEIGIDNYRSYHPNYLAMEKLIKKHWEGNVPDDNSSPGNDIADFTHGFAGRISDILTDMTIAKLDGKSYNIVMEWGMRTPEEPIKRMKEFKELGYQNIVNFIAVHEDISYEACVLRANVMSSQNHIVRRVPKSFHDLAVSTLPESSTTIYEETVLKYHAVDNFAITNRNGTVLWDPKLGGTPYEVYNQFLHNYALSEGMTNHEDIARMSYDVEAMGFDKSNGEPETEIDKFKM